MYSLSAFSSYGYFRKVGNESQNNLNISEVEALKIYLPLGSDTAFYTIERSTMKMKERKQG